ncbi:6-carboxytetrahydropterin synthase QueD [Desulfosarcina ovata]|uniref:6-carboxy-5,6,7,8-tetrahydropterin synthase n=1 Tax=Desulfosarcina ovata subsp. ovata TaxID=2752305 RepID=A0A5K8AB82_9BACT|nr:6-carboxytetrahydropterin synthase QueD [Desulfosarcina ovata]BBO89963.1 6-carboxytetrahydropterin synthase QueD [Desulfosarcina ovata subsp. ovata]
MFELKILSHFSAAHQLTMVAQKCENLHGHNWHVEVCVKGDRLNEAGVLIDFGIIKKYVKEIMQRLDHQFLNELPYFEKDAPSSENLAVYIASSLKEMIDDPGITVSRVTAWESDNASATYFPPA